MLLKTFQLGIKNLLLHKLRSLLTMLGVILGVGSVIAMLAIGEGSKREALERIRQLGASNVIIRSVKPNNENSDEEDSNDDSSSNVIDYGLRYKDLDRLTATLPTIEGILPISLLRKRAQAQHRGYSNARILGTTPDFIKVKNLLVRRGRFLSDTDLERTATVAVLSAGAAEKLFSFEDPLGKPVRLGSVVFRIVGILEPQSSGSAVAGAVGNQDFNKDIYIPLSAARHRFGELKIMASSRQLEKNQLSEITLTVSDENFVSQTAAMARKLLESSHPKFADIEVQVPLELLRQAEDEKRTWNLVLSSIAGISLLVGGIGIMNIMLATVTERTREIGIRRALGAKRIDITIQFLVESVVLSSTGGLLGMLLGVVAPYIVTYWSKVDSHLLWWPLPVTFLISVGIGIVFGVYPARRAALMDPIEALRHE